MANFVHVVDTGSSSGAARQLRIGQPAVSKTIARLEDVCRCAPSGVLIGRACADCDAGLRFYERARLAIQEEVDEAELEARGTGARPAAVIRQWGQIF